MIGSEDDIKDTIKNIETLSLLRLHHLQQVLATQAKREHIEEKLLETINKELKKRNKVK